MPPLRIWNWQHPDWPDFQYDSSRLKAMEDDFLLRSGLLLGAYLHVTEAEKTTLIMVLSQSLRPAERNPLL